MILKKMECHDCGVSLDREGVSEFLECPSCERRMLASEWEKINDGEGFEATKDIHKAILIPQGINSMLGSIRMELFDSSKVIDHEKVIHESVRIAYNEVVENAG